MPVWLVHEQVCVAALDIHDVKLAMECIKKLNAKFPDSTRVGRLRGMALESEVSEAHTHPPERVCHVAADRHCAHTPRHVDSLQTGHQ
jgi:hypothetical protein